MSAEPVDDLTRARMAFDAWRSAKPHPGRIPAELWAQALALVPHHGESVVCRELGIRPDRLRAQMAAARPTPESPFVELRPAPIAPALARPRRDRRRSTAETLSEIELSIARADGSSLVLALPPENTALVERLCRAFLSSRA